MTNRDRLEELFRTGKIAVERGTLFDRHLPPKPAAFDFDRVEGMLLGVAVGDGLGITTEGWLPGERAAAHGRIRDYLPNKYVGDRRGYPSDDTQLTFWTLEQMILDRGFVPERVAARLAQGRIFGMGSTVRRFLVNLKSGRPWYESGPLSAGNGALMRISPMLIPHLKTGGTDIWVDTSLSAMMTHNDPASISACLAYVAMLWELLDMEGPPDRQWWVDRYVALARDLEGEAEYSPRGGAMKGYRGPLWRFVQEHVPSADREGLSVAEACHRWYSGAFLLETVPSVLFILTRHADDPEEAIVAAVNDTKDNDTIAAIVGAAVGALHGRRGIPQRWLADLTGRTTDRDDGRIFTLLDQARSVYWEETMRTDHNETIPFVPGDYLIDRKNPGQPGQFTGRSRKAGPYLMLELSYPAGGTKFRPLPSLERMAPTHSMLDRLRNGHFGKLRDLQRLITFEKLKGTLHEIIYSMEAAQIDFYPYQFKPVLKFISSPTERLLIADEVGLGKTIESALIWMELQARRQAQRLLVICTKMLAEKWREELRTKFLLDARIVDFTGLRQEIEEVRANGPEYPFVLIATYSGLRPPKKELRLLPRPPEEEISASPKTLFLQNLRQWPADYDPIDLLIFDEADYMRNPASAAFHLCQSLAIQAGAVLCVTATPVNNTNADLHTLLRLVDDSFFESRATFDALLDANRPTVQAGNALARRPVDMDLLGEAVRGMATSRFISQSPLFQQFRERIQQLDPEDKSQLARCQELSEKLNLLGSYVNRTRRVQVKEHRPLRDPQVLVVDYSAEERKLYQAILELVRRKCSLDSRPFHVFQVLGLQLRAASCLPALAQEIRSGRFGDAEELLGEAISEGVIGELFEDELAEDVNVGEIGELLEYDFEANDSKYRELRRMFGTLERNEKVIIFAYYRRTLAYLKRRLLDEGMDVAVIHGGIVNEERWSQLERFRRPNGPRVLLSSEVGSAGIDLQFCRVVVNYDLPWNPMRVEQRIGRIDRVGQRAKKLSIVNFKVRDTIEERLYDRLHQKLERFANSLGDLEVVIGREVRQLTVELLSKELTREQEQDLMDQTERVIEQRLLEIQALEESGDALIAFSDYIQRKIEEDRERGRYLQPDELEDYLADFFEREFRGCEFNQNTPADGCMRVRLSHEAKDSLSEFVRGDRSLSARPLRQADFCITFRREVLERLSSDKRGRVHFVTHLSPLVRWITQVNREREHGFFDVSAIRMQHPDLPPGDYCYVIERWRMSGLSGKESLAYGIQPLGGDTRYSGDEAEAILQYMVRRGHDWDYVDVDREALLSAYGDLEDELARRFSVAVEETQAENETVYQIKEQRVRAIFDRRIEQDEQRLGTLLAAGRDPGIVRATEGRLRKARETKERRLHELKKKAEMDMEQVPVAAGVFRVSNHGTEA